MIDWKYSTQWIQRPFINFYIDARKKNGREYESWSLYSISCSLDRYIRVQSVRVVDRLISLGNLLWVLRKSLSEKQVKEKNSMLHKLLRKRKKFWCGKRGRWEISNPTDLCSFHCGSILPNFLVFEVVRSIGGAVEFLCGPITTESILYEVNVWRKQGMVLAKKT